MKSFIKKGTFIDHHFLLFIFIQNHHHFGRTFLWYNPSMKIRIVLLASIPLLVIILGVVYPTSGFDELPSSLVAWGTLMLAIATFALIHHNNKQEVNRNKADLLKEERGKQERFERENRERNIQLLNDAINWAEDLASCSFIEKTEKRHSAGNTLQRFRHILSKKIYIEEITSSFNDNDFNGLLLEIIKDKSNLLTVMVGLQSIDEIDSEIDRKEDYKQTLMDINKKDFSGLAKNALEMAKLELNAASIFIELEPTKRQLQVEVNNLIKHASKLKLKFISEASVIN